MYVPSIADAALQRAQAYLDAGADMLFPEALTDIDQFKQFKQVSGVFLACILRLRKPFGLYAHLRAFDEQMHPGCRNRTCVHSTRHYKEVHDLG